MFCIVLSQENVNCWWEGTHSEKESTPRERLCWEQTLQWRISSPGQDSHQKFTACILVVFKKQRSTWKALDPREKTSHIAVFSFSCHTAWFRAISDLLLLIPQRDQRSCKNTVNLSQESSRTSNWEKKNEWMSLTWAWSCQGMARPSPGLCMEDVWE